MRNKTKEIKEYLLLTIGVLSTIITLWGLGLIFYTTLFYGHRMF